MKTIINDITNEIVIKNSKFITLLIKIDDTTNILEIINKIKKDYPKATHYCYGYITENYKKSSDDGEPGGTAGIPILTTLEKEQMINVLAVVVRYFGGIKLGAGGLVRAYTKAIKEAIDSSLLTELVPGYEISVIFNYDKQKEFDYLFSKYEIISKDYLDRVIYKLYIPLSDINLVEKYEYKILNKLLIKKQNN